MANILHVISQTVKLKRNGQEWMGLCPFHNDHRPSLAVNPEKGVWKCHGCGAGGNVYDWVAKRDNIDLAEARRRLGNGNVSADPKSSQNQVTQPQRRIVATYDYKDENGKPLYQVLRFEPKDFSVRRPDGNGGWVWGLGDARKVLYHLDDIKRAIEYGETIFITEGEKDCDNLWGIGLVATTAPFGAGKWQPEYAECLKGGRIVILPDNDEPGIAHGLDIARSLYGQTKMLKLLALNGCKDVSDWLQAHDPEELTELVEKAPEWQPHLAPIEGVVRGEVLNVKNQSNLAQLRKVCAADLCLKGTPDLDFLPLLGQDGYIVKGWTTLIAGYPKAGKTELVTRLCHKWQQERILYITEEPESIWAVRLARVSDGWNHMWLLFALGMKPEDILSEIVSSDITVVIVDTVRNLFGLKDETDNSEVARALTPYITTCRNTNKTLLLLHHIRKGGGEHGEGITGGHAFLGIVDAALEILREPNLGDNKRRIRGWARVVAIQELVYVLNEDGSMEALGSPNEVELASVKNRVLEVVDYEWLGRKEVREALDEPHPSERQVQNALNELAGEGALERDPPIGEDKPGRKYLYRLPNLARTSL